MSARRLRYSSRNDLVIRQELVAQRANVIKIAEVAKKMEVHLNLLGAPATLPSPANQTPWRLRGIQSGRSRPQRKRTPTGKQIAATGSQNKEDGVARTEKMVSSLENVILWELENECIEVHHPVYEDITMPLMLLKSTLVAAIQTAVASGSLILPAPNVAFVAKVVDQLLLRATAPPPLDSVPTHPASRPRDSRRTLELSKRVARL